MNGSLPHTLSNLFLNAFGDGVSTTKECRLFQVRATLTVKKSPLMLFLHCWWDNIRLCPLLPSLAVYADWSCKMFGISLSYIPEITLQTSIMSLHSLLYAKLGNFNFSNLSGYERSLRVGNIRVALRCTFSMASIYIFFFIRCPHHIACSRCGLTIDLKRGTKLGYSHSNSERNV